MTAVVFTLGTSGVLCSDSLFPQAHFLLDAFWSLLKHLQCRCSYFRGSQLILILAYLVVSKIFMSLILSS